MDKISKTEVEVKTYLIPFEQGAPARETANGAKPALDVFHGQWGSSKVTHAMVESVQNKYGIVRARGELELFSV